MNDKLDDTTQGETNEDRVRPTAQSDASPKAEAELKPSRSRLPVIIAAIALIAIASFASWLFWPGRAGKPVPAPRSVSFDESANQPNASTGDQKLILTPEQARDGGLKIETVGEH